MPTLALTAATGAMMLAVFNAAAEQQVETRLLLKAEYRSDIIDYDGRRRSFCREKAIIQFEGGSAGITHLFLVDRKEHRFTWHIHLSSLSPYWAFILGNYRLNLGSGLIAGRIIRYDPDPFRCQSGVSLGGLYRPCDTGNPLFCFRGAASSATLPLDQVSFTVSGFFSTRNRYCQITSPFEATSDSFATIFSAYQKSGRRITPAEIIDWGATAEARIYNLIHLQGYFLWTEIRAPAGKALIWDAYGRNGFSGERGLSGYGFFARYRDDYFTIFIDVAASFKVSSLAPGRNRRSRAIGLQCGIAYRHQACALSFSVRSAGAGFYAPYSSSSTRGGTSCRAAASFRPHPVWRFGATIAADQSTAAFLRKFRSWKRLERVYLSFGRRREAILTSSLSAVQLSKDDSTTRAYRIVLKLDLFAFKSIRIQTGGKAQYLKERGRKKLDQGWSFHSSAGIAFSALRCLDLLIAYDGFFIRGNNTLYIRPTRTKDAVSHALAVKRPTHCLTSRIGFRWNDLRADAIARQEFREGRPRETRIEASCSCFL